MEIYVPDIYAQDIYTIDYKNLKSRGIKFLIFDLDNTLVSIKEFSPREETKELFKKLKKMGFKIYIASNSIGPRVKGFHDALNVEYVSCAGKPHSDKIKELIESEKFTLDQIAMIGDSMMDDVVCGNTIGITTVLLDQISKAEYPIAWMKRRKEKKIQKKLRDKDLFTKGRYYV